MNDVSSFEMKCSNDIGATGFISFITCTCVARWFTLSLLATGIPSLDGPQTIRIFRHLYMFDFLFRSVLLFEVGKLFFIGFPL